MTSSAAVNKQTPKRAPLNVLGTGGLRQFDGRIHEEFLPKLRGRFDIATYREMDDNSSAIGALRYLFRALTRQADWRMEPNTTAQDKAAAQGEADFVAGALFEDMSTTYQDLLSEVLSFTTYGWAYFEIVYKLRKGDTNSSKTRSRFDDGRVGWRKFALRPQDSLDRWQIDEEDDGIRGMHQLDAHSGKRAFIPIEKALLFRTETTKNNPEGRSLYRNAVIDWFFLKRIQEIEAVGIERDMTGLLTMQVPPEIMAVNASPDHKALRQDLEKMLSEIKRDEREFLMVPAETDARGNPTGYKASLLATGGRRPIDTNATKLYYKIAILQSVLAQFIQLGMGTVGSFALASSHTDLFAVAMGALLDSIESVFNRFAIPRLMQLNGVPSDQWPRLVHGDLETPPLDELGRFINSIAGADLLPTDKAPLQRKLMEIAGLPQPTEEGTRPARGAVEKARGPVILNRHGNPAR